MKWTPFTAAPTSPRASRGDFPVSAATTAATPSASSSSSWAILRRRAPRSGSGRRAQAGCAARAAATASPTSSRSERGTSEITSPVAGDRFSNVAPAFAAPSSPPMTLPIDVVLARVGAEGFTTGSDPRWVISAVSAIVPWVRRRTVGAAIAALALTVAISPPASATAARKIATGISDPLAGISSSHDAHWYQASAQANATYVRLNVDWARVAPTPPAHPSDPADPAYRFAETDAAIADAAGAHLIPVLTLYDAPRWAEDKPIPPHLSPRYAGGWKP